MLTTLLTITAGRAAVAGIDVADDADEARGRIGVALQEAGLDPRQTGRELLLLHGRLFELDAARAAERARELLALVELEEAADRVIKGYSGGSAGSTSRRHSSTSRRCCSSTSRPLASIPRAA